MKKLFLISFLLFVSCGNSLPDTDDDNDSGLNDSEIIDEELNDTENDDDLCSVDEDKEWSYVIEDAYFNKIVSDGNGYAGIGFYIEPYDYGNGYYENVYYSMIARLEKDFSVKWMMTFEETGYVRDFSDFFVSEDGYIYAAGTKNGKEFFLAKISDSAELLWQVFWKYDGFHVSGENIINSIKPVSDGIYAGGFTAGGNEEGRTSYPRLYVAKVDYEGNLIWERTWGPGGSIVGSFEVDDIENIYMTGYTVGSLDGNENAGKPGDCATLPWGPEGSSCPDPFLIKMDKNGEIKWSRQFGSEDINIIDFGIDVKIDNKGDAYVLSYSRMYGGEKIVVRKFNPNGELIWEKIQSYEREQYFEGTAINIDNENGLINISGSFFENRLSSKRAGIVLSFDIENGNLVSELKYSLGNRVSFSGFVEEPGKIKYVFGQEIIGFNQISPDINDIQPVYKAGIKTIACLKKDIGPDRSISTGDEFARETIFADYSSGDVAVFSAKDGADNILIAGNTIADSKDKNVFLLKYDKDRKQVRKKSYGSDKLDNLVAGYNDESGNIVLSGTTYGNFEKQDRFGVGDLFVVKINDSGETIWIDLTGSDNDDWSNGMHVDKAGNIFVAGGTWGSIDDNEFIDGFGSNIFVGSWGSDGEKKWIYQWGPRIEGMAVTSDNSGNIYVAGKADIPYGELPVFSNNGIFDNIIFKLNEEGSEIDAKTWGSEGHDVPTGVAMDSAGNIYVTGYTFGAIDGNIHLGADCPGGYCPDAYLTKFNGNLEKQWTRQFGTEHEDRATAISIDENDVIYITGTAGKNRYCEIESDIFLAIYDTSGEEKTFLKWGTAGEEIPRGLTVKNGEIIITGSTTGGLDGNENKGGKDGFVTIIKTEDLPGREIF